MKIEDSPYQFTQGHDIDKTRLLKLSLHGSQALDEEDLSFLELLNTMRGNLGAAALSTLADAPLEFTGRQEAVEREKQAEPANKTSSPQPTEAPGSTSNSRTHSTSDTQDSDLELLNAELTAEDIQYFRQIVIPGLPILQGSVPTQAIFGAGGDNGISYRGFSVSGKLMELVETGIKTGRPIRVELDPNSSVVLRFREGRVSAEFLSSEKGMALMMKQGIDELRARMEAKNLPVGTLEYREDPSRGKRRQQSSHEQE